MKFLFSIILLFSFLSGFSQSPLVKLIDHQSPSVKLIDSLSDKTQKGKRTEVYICCGEKHKPPLFILNGYVIGDSLLAKINPHQIQSIDILKDAVAVEKYGAKAKNGVVSLTAKPEAVDELVKQGILKPIL